MMPFARHHAAAPVFLNRIGTATPRHEVHGAFRSFAASLLDDPRRRDLFHRMAERADIDERWSVLCPEPGEPCIGDIEGFYRAGQFPGTTARMARYETDAPKLADAVLADLALSADEIAGITHLVVASCTGFVAPGLDHAIAARLGLAERVERTIVGFMGCQAAITALKLAWHMVRSVPAAKVLVVNLELCTLHLQQCPNLDQLLCFLLFADGASAGLVSAEPTGMRLDGFHAAVIADSRDQITWRIGEQGFDMTLSGMVPVTLARALPARMDAILAGADPADVELWAVHPGGRTILDAVQHGLSLPQGALATSREILRRFGNMSSPTIMFVLRAMLDHAIPGRTGCAMAFGPGLSAETMRFATV
jgi:alpha-pyrone synthase